jgi:hypothetical protein
MKSLRGGSDLLSLASPFGSGLDWAGTSLGLLQTMLGSVGGLQSVDNAAVALPVFPYPTLHMLGLRRPGQTFII